MTSDLASSPLARSAPEHHGLPSSAVFPFLEELAEAEVELHSLMLLRHGDVVAEGWWWPYRREHAQLLYSLSKSFTSTAVGLAVAEGRLSVDDLVVSFFPGVDEARLHPRVRRMRVRHLLTMATGHHENVLPLMSSDDLAGSFCSLVPEEEPGDWFTYNNAATLLLSLVVTAVTGDRLLEYLRPRLLDPLGVDEAYWRATGAFDQGFSGLHLTTESVARFGQLHLDGGSWQGRQVVTAGWVAEATRRHVDTPREPELDWRQGYGYQFWRCQHGAFRGDGAFGQFCVVMPEQDMVLVTTAATEDMQAILTAAWSHLLPNVTDNPLPADGTHRELISMLERLSLPVVQGSATPDGPVGPGPWLVHDPASEAARELSIVEASDRSGWLLDITDPTTSYQVPCGHLQWRSGSQDLTPGLLQTSACGAWTGPATFTADIAFTQSPHRLTVVADVAAGTLSSVWRPAPLGLTHGSQLAVGVPR